MELAATLAFSNARASKVDLLEQQVHQLTQELVQWESHHKEFMNAAMSTFLGQQDDLIEELHRRLEIAEARLVQYDHQQVQQYQSGQGLPLGGWAGGGRAQEDLRTMSANSMQGGAAGSTGPAGSAWGRPASAGPVGGAGGGSHMNGQNTAGGGSAQFWREECDKLQWRVAELERSLKAYRDNGEVLQKDGGNGGGGVDAGNGDAGGRTGGGSWWGSQVGESSPYGAQDTWDAEGRKSSTGDGQEGVVRRLKQALRAEQESSSKQMGDLLIKYNVVKERNVVLEVRDTVYSRCGVW